MTHLPAIYVGKTVTTVAPGDHFVLARPWGRLEIWRGDQRLRLVVPGGEGDDAGALAPWRGAPLHGDEGWLAGMAELLCRLANLDGVLRRVDGIDPTWELVS